MSRKAVALVLGGSIYREDFALTTWHQQNPDVPIYISGGSTTEDIYARLAPNGESLPPFVNDLRAKTTNGNFTSMVDIFKEQGYQHVYVLTSSYHMKRSMVLANIILGSRGLTSEGVVAHDDPGRVESTKILVLDSAIASLWVALGPLGDKVLRSKLYHPEPNQKT